MEKEIVYTYYDPEFLEEGKIVFAGHLEEIEGDLLVSIRDLNRELDEQKMLLEIGYHPDEYLCPWVSENGIAVVREGKFTWNPDTEAYEKVENNK